MRAAIPFWAARYNLWNNTSCSQIDFLQLEETIFWSRSDQFLEVERRSCRAAWESSQQLGIQSRSYFRSDTPTYDISCRRNPHRPSQSRVYTAQDLFLSSGGGTYAFIHWLVERQMYNGFKCSQHKFLFASIAVQSLHAYNQIIFILIGLKLFF